MNDVATTMIEKLEENPDAAVLVTIDELDGEQSACVSFYADHDERPVLARRVLAGRAAAMLGKHFPNQAKDGVAKMAGGTVSFDGVFRDQEIDWERYHDPEKPDPPRLSEATDE